MSVVTCRDIPKEERINNTRVGYTLPIGEGQGTTDITRRLCLPAGAKYGPLPSCNTKTELNEQVKHQISSSPPFERHSWRFLRSNSCPVGQLNLVGGVRATSTNQQRQSSNSRITEKIADHNASGSLCQFHWIQSFSHG